VLLDANYSVNEPDYITLVSNNGLSVLTESGGRLRFAKIVADCFRATQKFERFSCGPAIALPTQWMEWQTGLCLLHHPN
jgi:hypothetical protein